MDQITPEQEQLAEDAARAIVDTAKALHPGDPVRQAACALNAALHLQVIWPGQDQGPLYEGTTVSAESPCLTPAEVERKIAGERIPWNGRR